MPVPWLDDRSVPSGSADAQPDEGVYKLDPGGLHLITPLSGA